MSEERYDELRQLLLGREQERLDAIDRQLADPGLHVEAVSDVLPEAINRRANDRALGAALGPVVGDAIKASVRRDPQPLVDAIFPIIGPAIRRAIASALSELSQSVNTTLEHAFTPRGIRWRLEAWRTGRTFGEVVLNHSLVFRAEQLFLIHRDTGLLIHHVTAPGVKALSPDMVAGLLTAITQFAQDSFEVSRLEGLDSFALGDLTVMAEQGPGVVLAAAVRGQAPASYREALQEAVEGVQHAHAEQIEVFGREGRAFAVRDDLLEPCLATQRSGAARAGGNWRLATVGVLVLAAFGGCAIPRLLEARRVGKYLARLRAEPGVVVGDVDRSRGRTVVSGLRDPLAADPVALLAEYGLDTTHLVGHWEPYVALRPEFMASRARAILQAPGSVRISARQDTLIVDGVGSSAFIDRVRTLGPALAGISIVDTRTLADSIDLVLRAVADTAEAITVAFDRGAEWPRQGSRAALDSLGRSLQQVVDLASRTARSVRIDVHSATDSVGSDEVNRALRLGRARALRSLLVARGVPPDLLTASPDSARGARQGYIRVHVRGNTGNP